MSQVGRGWVVGGPPGAPPSQGEGVALSKLGGMRECERVWGGDAWETDCFILPTPVCSSPVPRPSCPGGIRVRPGKGFGTEKKHPRKEGNIPLFTVIAKQKQIIRLRERRWDYLDFFNEALVGL